MLWFFLPNTIFAQEEVYLVLTEVDGKVYKFALTDKPVVTFSNDQLVVNCDGESMDTSLENILKWTHETEATGIEFVQAEPQAPRFAFNNAVFEGFPIGTQVSIFSLDGKILKNSVANDSGTVKINLQELGKGTFIIRTPNRSFKIHNK